MANTSIYRNIASTGNSDICTISCWFKKDFTGVEKALFGGWRSSTDRFQIRFKDDDTIDVEFGYSGSWYSLITNRKFRDPSSWMHLVLAIDSTQGTPANREKLYINGVQETSFSTEVYMPQNNDTLMTTSGDEVMVGSSNQTSGSGTHQGFWKGCMSHVQFVDGLQLAPTEFGEFDATSGIWKIITTAYGTPGTNGFFLKMEDSTNMDLDSSSNSLTFTTEGTLTSTKDNPSNNFATFNPLLGGNETQTFTNSNTTVNFGASGQWGYNASTQAVSSGKWYFELKCEAVGGETYVGIMDEDDINANQVSGGSGRDWVGKGTNSIGLGQGGYMQKNSANLQTGLATYTTGDIISMELNLVANTLQYYKNDVAVGTTAAVTAGKTYFFAVSGYSNTKWNSNFGNGYFGTTAITSAGTNASGNGTFEYDVPTGFTALCTKGINS